MGSHDNWDWDSRCAMCDVYPAGDAFGGFAVKTLHGQWQCARSEPVKRSDPSMGVVRASGCDGCSGCGGRAVRGLASELNAIPVIL